MLKQILDTSDTYIWKIFFDKYALAIILCFALYSKQLISVVYRVQKNEVVKKFFFFLAVLLLTIMGYAITILLLIPAGIVYLIFYLASYVVYLNMYYKYGDKVTASIDLDSVWCCRSEYGRPFINIAMNYDGCITLDQIKERFIEKIFKYRDSNGKNSFRKFFQIYEKKMGYVFWKDCDNFDLDNHVQYVDLCDLYPKIDDQGSENKYLKCNEQLLTKFVSDHGNIPLPENQPQWQVVLLAKGRQTK